METPPDLNAVLRLLLTEQQSDTVDEPCVLAPEGSALAAEDELYLSDLVAELRSGKRAVLIVEDSDDRLKYMFSNATRAEAISMLGKVIEATGRRLANGED